MAERSRLPMGAAGVRIGLVSPYSLDEPGGVQAQVLGLAEALAGRGHEPVVVGPRRTLRVRANGSLVPMGVGGPGKALDDVDVAHVHEPVLPFGLAALGADRPTVATFHADPPAWGVAAIKATAPVIRGRLADARTTAVSTIAARPWQAIGLEPVIIPNGVAVPEPAPTPTRAPHRVAFVGRDDPRKGLGRLLRAWPAVRAAVPDAELVVVGAEAEGEGVVGLGRVDEDEKWQALAGAAVACAPNSGGESFGIVLVEAMASGCALVCTDLPAFRETAGDAAVFVGRDEPLDEALAALLTDEGSRRRLSDAGRERATSYRWETVTDRYLAMYAAALD